MDTKALCEQEFIERIERIESLLLSAKSCLKERDYFQGLVRLELMEKECTFTEFQRRIFESVSP